jgi:hypothetical protein
VPLGNGETLGSRSVEGSVKTLIGIIRVWPMGSTPNRCGVAVVGCIRITSAISKQPLRNQQAEVMTFVKPGAA